VQTFKDPKSYSDGGGLWLEVRPSGGRSWLFLSSKGGKQKWMGLGPYPDVPLAEARDKALELRRKLLRGEGLALKSETPTFAKATEQFLITNKNNCKRSELGLEWHNQIKRHAAALDDFKVDVVTQDHILEVIRPIWDRLPATAQALLNKLDRILSFSVANKWRSDNPADWKLSKVINEAAEKFPRDDVKRIWDAQVERKMAEGYRENFYWRWPQKPAEAK
jgi:hypothetical protein